MTHLILCREYPPAAYAAGGIGTYVRHMARLLAEAGETVHVIAQRWEGAPARVMTSLKGCLIVHRLSLDEPVLAATGKEAEELRTLELLASSTCPTQVFSWQAAKYAEWLVENEPIDVIEAQEWEAPLYYLQARRAVGLGPKRQPPCIVHLHSPSQMIFDYNEWDQTLTDFGPLVRFEEYSIRAADALLCPSRYLADGVIRMFGLAPGRVEVIPYAMGVETPLLERSLDVWAHNAICYVGRLELRKGVVELVDAAVQVASVNDSVSFDFFGSDTAIDGGVGRSVMATLKRQIPAALRTRFRFHGSRSREELMHALTHVAVAVVPSRWENFPFTCIEAMSTGLPVLASPNGGMAEMIVDGESGWICADGSATGLAAGLLRVLATPPEVRAAMGANAAETIRTICDNDAIVARQIAFRKRVAAAVLQPPEAPQTQRQSGVVLTHSDKNVQLEPEFVAACEAAFEARPELELIVPWILREPDDLDPGPWLAGGEMPEYAVVRAAVAHPTHRDGAAMNGARSWVTYPGLILRVSGRHKKPRRRYSGMALIASTSPAFALRWILSAPLREQLRWLSRVMANPQRILRRLAWRIRGIARARGRDAK